MYVTTSFSVFSKFANESTTVCFPKFKMPIVNHSKLVYKYPIHLNACSM